MKRFDVPSLNKLIDKHGWIVTGVPGGALYTVGMMEKFAHPEVAIHGLPPMSANAILRAAVAALDGGSRFHPDRLQWDIAEGYPTKIVPVSPSNFVDWFGQAFSYHQDDLQMLQLVWPDREGRFPGDPDYFLTRQKVFDVRHDDYDQIKEEWPEGQVCGKCGEGDHCHDKKT